MKKLQLERLREVLTDLQEVDKLEMSKLTYDRLTDTLTYKSTSITISPVSVDLVTLFTENDDFTNSLFLNELRNTLVLYISKKHAKNNNIWTDKSGLKVMVVLIDNVVCYINYRELIDRSSVSLKQLSPFKFLLNYR